MRCKWQDGLRNGDVQREIRPKSGHESAIVQNRDSRVPAESPLEMPVSRPEVPIGTIGEFAGSEPLFSYALTN